MVNDLKQGRLEGYDTRTLQGRLMNKKNVVMTSIVKSIYMEPRYISPCHAGSLFGIIGAEGTVRPCEILEKPLGNVRDYGYDFLKLWHDRPAQDMKRWIRDTKCNCSYECAWSFNILGNARYQPALIAAALGKYW
jgi:MoaA/NifB/PqqE/SkfB family radical SAM enzyme